MISRTSRESEFKLTNHRSISKLNQKNEEILKTAGKTRTFLDAETRFKNIIAWFLQEIGNEKAGLRSSSGFNARWILQSGWADFVCLVAVETAEFDLLFAICDRIFPEFKTTVPNPEFPQLAVPKSKDQKAWQSRPLPPNQQIRSNPSPAP